MKYLVYHSQKTLFLIFALLCFPFFAQAPQTLELTLLATTDLHCSVLSYDYYKDREDPNFGLERLATLIHQARSEFPHTLLLDSGDTLQGNPLADYKAWIRPVRPEETHPIYKVMNYLRYDAAAIGNHEFNYGLDFLMQVTQKAQFPNLLANVYTLPEKKTLFPPYVILERTFGSVSLKIGVLGLTPPQILQWDRDHLLHKVEVDDVLQSARHYIPEMRAQGADLIIVLLHGGLSLDPYTEKMENACYYLAQEKGIHAILFGHSHGKFPGEERFKNLEHRGVNAQEGQIHGCPAVMSGFWGNTLGLIHLTLEKQARGWQVIQGRGELRSLQQIDGSFVPPDPEVRKLVQLEHEETRHYVNTPLCKTEIQIHTYFSHCVDSHAIQIVNNAQRDYVQKQLQGTPDAQLPILSAIAPFKTNFRDTGYTDIPIGNVSIKNIADLYLYPNTLHAVKITGAILKEWLEKSAHIYNQIDPENPQDQYLLQTQFPSYNHDIIDGITYEVDVSKPVGNRIYHLCYQEKPISPTMEFIVATNNYRASGGGNFPGLDGSRTIFRSPDTVQQILIDYVKNRKLLGVSESADHNWTLKPLILKGRLLFKSAPNLQSLLETQKITTIQFLNASEDSTLYQIRW